MRAATNLTATVVGDHAEAVGARCPHLSFRKVLGAETVAALLDYVAGRERDFTPAEVWKGQLGKHRIDRAVRDGCHLWNLGEFEVALRGLLAGIAVPALQQLGLFEPSVEVSEFEICAYGDGGHFAPHVDTLKKLERVRILSCVYYFAATPRRFSGGVLRLHGFPRRSAGGGLASPVDIMPETDSLVVFPSWLLHEVLPVAVPSGAWSDRRFTINCWIHRADPAGRRHRLSREGR